MVKSADRLQTDSYHTSECLSFPELGELTRSGCGYALCCTWEEWARLWGPAGPPGPSHPPDTPDTSAAAAGTSFALHKEKERTSPKTTTKEMSHHNVCGLCVLQHLPTSHQHRIHGWYCIINEINFIYLFETLICCALYSWCKFLKKSISQ